MLMRLKQIEQAGAEDQNVLSWETDEWAPSFVFASNWQVAESLGQSNTNSTTYQQKLRITLPSALPAGTYRLEWSCCIDNEDESEQTNVRVQLDDTAVVFEVGIPPLVSDPARAMRHPVSGHADVVLAAGSHYFDLDYSTTNATYAASIADTRFAVWRVS